MPVSGSLIFWSRDIQENRAIFRGCIGVSGHGVKIRAQALADGMDFNPVNGVPKGTKILPVITLVFYVGKKPWDGPRELYDMFDIPEDKKEWAKHYIPNYPLHILDARHLTDEQIESCNGDLKTFFYMIREDYDEEKLRGYVAKFRETCKSL